METKIKVCKKHGETTYQKNSQGKWICIKCRTEAKVKSRRKITKLNRSKAIIYKGGKCVKCGYNTCPNALEFHHVDPTKKDINFIKLKTKSFERFKIELDKCILVCANCHREIHYEMNKELD